MLVYASKWQNYLMPTCFYHEKRLILSSGIPTLSTLISTKSAGGLWPTSAPKSESGCIRQWAAAVISSVTPANKRVRLSDAHGATSISRTGNTYQQGWHLLERGRHLSARTAAPISKTTSARVARLCDVSSIWWIYNRFGNSKIS